MVWLAFFFQAEDGIRDLVRSRGLGDVYKRQDQEKFHESPRSNRDGTQSRQVHRLPYVFGDLQELSLIHI